MAAALKSATSRTGIYAVYIISLSSSQAQKNLLTCRIFIKRKWHPLWPPTWLVEALQVTQVQDRFTALHRHHRQDTAPLDMRADDQEGISSQMVGHLVFTKIANRLDRVLNNSFFLAGQIMEVGYPYRPPQPSRVEPSTSGSQSMSDPNFAYANPPTSGMVESSSSSGIAQAMYDIFTTCPTNFIPQSISQPPSLSGEFVEQHGKGAVAISPHQPTSSGAPAAISEAQSGEFNPYAQLLNKANLIIDGDLDSMATNWTAEEWSNRRRLVQFWRRQGNNEIICTFSPVAPADRQPNSIVVSCIYWEDRKECFITSVDTIFLLESLIGVKFTVEEKNRIRRNLEGFRPLTVSKVKPDSADFFKLVMSFPNPKPRNIEKDVKAFHWTTLPLALKKIIGKYTASYSSTASVN